MHVLPSSSQILHWISGAFKCCRNVISHIANIGRSVVSVKTCSDMTFRESPSLAGPYTSINDRIVSVRTPKSPVPKDADSLGKTRDSLIKQLKTDVDGAISQKEMQIGGNQVEKMPSGEPETVPSGVPTLAFSSSELSAARQTVIEFRPNVNPLKEYVAPPLLFTIEDESDAPRRLKPEGVRMMSQGSWSVTSKFREDNSVYPESPEGSDQHHLTEKEARMAEAKWSIYDYILETNPRGISSTNLGNV